MSKEEFLRELEQDLAARGVEDRAAYRDFFEEIYEDMREEGLTEEEAAGRLGDPERSRKPWRRRRKRREKTGTRPQRTARTPGPVMRRAAFRKDRIR